MSDEDPGPSTFVEAAIAIASVGTMLVILYLIGRLYDFDPLSQAAAGGEMIVYSIIFFIIFMAAVGIAIAYTFDEVEAPAQ